MKLDRAYYATLFSIAVPIMIQSLISSGLNMVDVLMIGQLGETAVAAVGLANQIFFLLTFLLFGIGSGAGVFTAQLWGRGDVPSIRKVLGLCLLMGAGGGVVFTIIALLFPQAALGVYSNDAAVIELGSGYLRIVGFSYVLTAVAYSYAAVLRSTGNVRLPMAVSVVALGLKTLIAYLLIFGIGGLPALGITGAAIGTVVARTLECALLLFAAYRLRTPVAARLTELLGFDRTFVRTFLKVSLPVVFNEMLWALGITTYNVVYAHISTEAIAAVNIVSTIENLAFVIFIGISDACAIMVGNKIGAGQEAVAHRYARRTILLATGGAILMGGVIFLLRAPILSLYNISPTSSEYVYRILTVLACALWVRVSNMTLIVGILRSGGDTRFGFILDAGVMWGIGVPSAFIGAFVFGLPVYWVYMLVLSEELVKYLVGLRRMLSRRWVHNLTQTFSAAEVA